MSPRKKYYYRRSIGDPLETNMRDRTPIGDISETHRRHIGDPSETDMPDQRPRNTSSETDMPVEKLRRPTCLRSPMGI